MDAPWVDSFIIEGDEDAGIGLSQINRREFLLTSTITYVGEITGLEGKLSEDSIALARNVSPERMPITDLVSVPPALQWFVGRYGVHTPAALIHDWLIPTPSDPPVPGMTDPLADRYFRFMLKDLGVRVIRRWLMWTAVALRTRIKSGRLKALLLIIWLAASVTGMAAFGLAVASLLGVELSGWYTDVVAAAGGEWPLIFVAAAAPFVFAALWGKQYGAGILAAYSAPWIVPPTVFVAAGYVIYAILELLVSRADEEGDEPIHYKYF